VQLTNTGTQTLNVSELKVKGPQGLDFSQRDDCRKPIPAGTSCTIRVTFDPRKKGPRSGAVYITDDGGGSPQTIPLTGTSS